MKCVGDLISNIFDERFLEKTKSYSAFFDCWEDLMLKNGIASAAGHSWIKSAEKGLVWIEVDHPGWKQILQTKESKLLHDFKYRFPDMGISGISIVLCKAGTNKEQVAGSREQREESGEQRAIANKVGASNEQVAKGREQRKESQVAETSDTQYSDIKDEELRALLERLEKHIAERDKE
jgi:hypothetical protein